MLQLHESVKDTYKETIIKADDGFRFVLKKFEVPSINGLFNIEFEQQSIEAGVVTDSTVYTAFMTKEEMAVLAAALVA
jgi:hypothetical protein